MDQQYFPLGNTEDSRLVKMMKIIFGVACIGMAIFWSLFNLRSDGHGNAMWVTVLFILGFGIYMIWAGLGRSVTYILVGPDFIRIKQNPLQGPETFSASDIKRIEILPLSLVFFFGSGKKTILRLGTVNYETNEEIIDSIAAFCEKNNIPYEVKDENIE